MATYRELIQDVHGQFDQTYEKIKALRDAAFTDELGIYNDTVNALSRLMIMWSQFDNQLTEGRAKMELGWQLPDWKYEKHINE